ncbi:MAG: hypothetical protein ABII79_08300 [bacterium]
MRIAPWFLMLGLAVALGCDEDREEPPPLEKYSGEMEIDEFYSGTPAVIDTVVFTIEGTQYHLTLTTHNSGICSSGGEIGNFGTNMIRLTQIYYAPGGGCDSVRLPQGEFSAAFRGDSLILGPKTVVYDITGDSLGFTFRLKK